MAALTALTGIQNLTNLTNLRADGSNNALETINVSGMTSLISLDISDCNTPGSGDASLKNINVSGCTSLQQLYIDDSDFSEGFPDLSSLSSLTFFDADQSNIGGSVDLSNLPALSTFDLSGNTGLNEVIISSSQSLGGSAEDLINIRDCALTQESVDDILIALSQNGESAGEIAMEGGSNAAPSEAGVEALRALVAEGWTVSTANYYSGYALTSRYNVSTEACPDVSYTTTGYTYAGAGIAIGNFVYQDDRLITPLPDGWYKWEVDGISYEVSGGLGEITSGVGCA